MIMNIREWLLVAALTAPSVWPSVVLAQGQGQPMGQGTMTGCPMMGSGMMMWGIGLVGLVLVIVLVLAAAALIKYLFFSRATA
jgi:hypothetical protein